MYSVFYVYTTSNVRRGNENKVEWCTKAAAAATLKKSPMSRLSFLNSKKCPVSMGKLYNQNYNYN